MVMVLLFLGVVFLLVGFQAMGSAATTSDDSARSPTVTTTHRGHATSASAGAGEGRGAGIQHLRRCRAPPKSTANRLREAGWNVTETGNLTLPDVTATTVYFSDAPGEQRGRRRGRQVARGAGGTAAP